MSGIEVAVIIQAVIVLMLWFHADALSAELKLEREEQNKLWNRNKKLANENDELRYKLGQTRYLEAHEYANIQNYVKKKENRL